MKDFTLTTYKELLQKSFNNGYSFQTFQGFIHQLIEKAIILRHDVDRKPGNALVIGKIEKEIGIKASYFFRIVKESYDENIIRQIADMGHEIGYHYENLSEISKQKRVKSKEELFELAIEDFESNLEKFRKIYPVKTICMHGSPFSKYDNKKIWDKYDYRDYGIIAEPYFDIDFNEVFYITDTGRSWNNSNASIRDKVNSKFDIKIKNTRHLIEKIQNNELPDKIMINVHPQRWNDAFVPWVSELVRQNIKNIVKRNLIRFRD
jgi:hypothetical protein